MSISQYDAWAMGRVLAHGLTPDQLEHVSDDWRPWATRLASLDVESRVTDYGAMCADMPAAVVRSLESAMDSVNSDGPPPVASEGIPSEGTNGDGVSTHGTTADASWPPLRIGEPPSVEPFPIDVLPRAVADLVAEGAMAIGCPCDFLAVPVLAVAGGAVGRSVSLMLKAGYFAPPVVFAACVGPPSDGKTPALKIAAAPLRRIDDALALEHEHSIKQWEAECDRVGSNGKKSRPTAPPRPRRIDIDDVTMEALPLILADNPRGLVMIRDELSALVLGLNQFKSGKGSDRASLLKIWSGDAFKKDRVAHENNAPIRCPHPSLAIVGGMTPDMMGELADPRGRADGFTDRFLFTFPNSPSIPSWTNAGVPDDVAEGWADVVERLWSRPLDIRDGRSVPHVARMTPRAETAWRRLYDEHSTEMNDPGFPPSMRGPWGKLREYAGRLALILALLDHAADPTVDAVAVPDASERHIENAWRLVAYFKSHARRVHAAVSLGVSSPEAAAAKAVIGWIRKDALATFTESQLKQARRWIEPEPLAKALLYLSKANAIRPQEAPQGTAKGGRPPSPVYDVNPALTAN